MKKFCRDIGVDKKTLMAMMIGKDNLDDITPTKNDVSSSRKDPLTQSKDNMKDSIQPNTG